MHIGAMLLLTAFSCLGISAAKELRRETGRFAALREAVREMEIMICRQNLPLPQVTERFLSDRHSERYGKLIRGDILPASADERLFSTLLGQLRGGEIPEKAFACILAELEWKQKDAMEREKRYSRLCSAGGIGIGLVLCLVFL